MHLASDHIHPAPKGGRCRVRIYLPEDELLDAPVVILTELANNPGQSVTNAVGRIAASVIESFKLPESTVWIEHYEEGSRRGTEGDTHTFDLVVFEDGKVREVLDVHDDGWGAELGEPSWRALDRGAVETLVGEELER